MNESIHSISSFIHPFHSESIPDISLNRDRIDRIAGPCTPWLGGPPSFGAGPGQPLARSCPTSWLLDGCLPAQAHGTTVTSAATTPPPMARLTHFGRRGTSGSCVALHPEAMSLTFKAGAKGALASAPRPGQLRGLGGRWTALRRSGGTQALRSPDPFNGQRFDSPFDESLSGHPVPGPCRQKPTGQAQACTLRPARGTQGSKAWVRLISPKAADWPQPAPG